MTTLVLHVPRSMVVARGASSFESAFKRAMGDGYAIASTEFPRISARCKVVLLDEQTQQRAEGKLRTIMRAKPPNHRTKTNMPRYDVHIDELKRVPYAPAPTPEARDRAARYRGIQILP